MKVVSVFNGEVFDVIKNNESDKSCWCWKCKTYLDSP